MALMMCKLHAKKLAIAAFSATAVSIIFNLLYVMGENGGALKKKELHTESVMRIGSTGHHDQSLRYQTLNFTKSKDTDRNVGPVKQQGQHTGAHFKTLDAPPLTEERRVLEIVNPHGKEISPPTLAKVEVNAHTAGENKTDQIKEKEKTSDTGNKQAADTPPTPTKVVSKTRQLEQKNDSEQDDKPLLKNYFVHEDEKFVQSKTPKDTVQEKVTNKKEDYNADLPDDFRDTVFDNEIMSFELGRDPLAKPDNFSYCPDKSPHLFGPLAGILYETTKEELVDIFPEMENGGRIRPADCVPRQRLAIIMPYRNRYPHLHIALHNLIPVLKRQQADATFFVIEQASNSTFNRGALLNIGFLEADKLGSFDCYIFHDVDLIPLNDRNLYRCESNPRHYAVAMNKYKFKLPYQGYFGGVVGFSKEQYLKINGNSNLYVGWGGEDDDLLKRLKNKNYKMLRYPNEIGRYNMIKHTRDKGNEVNPLRGAILKSCTKRQDIEGLNTVKYKILNITFDSLYTWITVSINTAEILKTAPEITLKDVSDARVKWQAKKQNKEKARKDALLKQRNAKATSMSPSKKLNSAHASFNSNSNSTRETRATSRPSKVNTSAANKTDSNNERHNLLSIITSVSTEGV